MTVNSVCFARLGCVPEPACLIEFLLCFGSLPMQHAIELSTRRTTTMNQQKNHKNGSFRGSIAGMLALSALSGPTIADLTFTQTVDGWWTNTYAWEAQLEQIVCLRNADPVGTVKSVWGRVAQQNGSGVGTAVYCTTMTKVSSGLTDRWNVNVPAGMITDKDFWDASVICFELMDCSNGSKRSYLSASSPYGQLRMDDYRAGLLSPQPEIQFASLDPIGWDDQLLRDDGFDFAVYAYLPEFGGLPIILNHVDELGLSTFQFNELDAFGTGELYDPMRIEILGIDLDPSWDQLALKSLGLQQFVWDLQPGGGTLLTDQGNFQILQVQPVAKGWVELCQADYTMDGLLDIFDIFAFLDAFNAGDPAGDFNADGVYDVFDVFAYLDAFNAGCP